jgi:hypothetical protein
MDSMLRHVQTTILGIDGSPNPAVLEDELGAISLMDQLRKELHRRGVWEQTIFRSKEEHSNVFLGFG